MCLYRNLSWKSTALPHKYVSPFNDELPQVDLAFPQIYKFSPADMCELARNSVIQSGFEMEIKRHWLGHDWYLPGAEGNVVDKTNVPNVRVAFRYVCPSISRTMETPAGTVLTSCHCSYNTLVEERTMVKLYHMISISEVLTHLFM